MSDRWSEPATARAYERFCAAHDRYGLANAALVGAAALEPGHRVLDVGAGTGRTAEAALAALGPSGSILCVEPSAAMAELGRARVTDERVSWAQSLPDPPTSFDRILCGAALWLLGPLDQALAEARALLASGGALCFNLPALYLGEPDAPGGGEDPMLLSIWAQLMDPTRPAARTDPFETLPDAAGVETQLASLGFEPVPWQLRIRLSQATQRDWLKIPPISEGVLAGVPPDERERRIDAAYDRIDPHAWRWEAWRGWTAWAR